MKKESYAIVGAAIEVHKQLGLGFLEAVYHEALQIELAARSIPFESLKELSIQYKSHILEKKYVADFVIYGKIIVEIKAQKALTDIDKAQVLNYLKATGLTLGILMNFRAEEKLEVSRLVRTTSN